MAWLRGAVVLVCACAAVVNAAPSSPHPGLDYGVENIDEQTTAVRRSLAVGDGYWSTSGNKIVDSEGNQVLFSGVNWNGFEAANCVVDGLWPGLGRSYKEHLQQMADTGFNLIRLAFAGTCVQPGMKPTASAIDAQESPDLKGLTTIEAMREVIRAAGALGIRVILDYHRRAQAPLNGDPEDGMWFNDENPTSYFLGTWAYVAESFRDEPAVVGVDVWNEPHDEGRNGPVWNDDLANPYNFYAAAKQAADVIQAIQPGWLICVQGMWENAWWGGNLQAVRQYPLTLTVPNKLVYSIHDYGPVVYPQPWFDVPEFPANMPAFWDSMWGFVHSEGIAPVWVGEFGSTHDFTSTDTVNAKEALWLSTFIRYIGNHSLTWTWFTWGPNSRDTGGILQEDWSTVNSAKYTSMSPILHPSLGASPILSPTEGSSPPAPPMGSGAWSPLSSVASTKRITFTLISIGLSILFIGLPLVMS